MEPRREIDIERDSGWERLGGPVRSPEPEPSFTPRELRLLLCVEIFAKVWNQPGF